MLAHGTAGFLKERMFNSSDKYVFYVCDLCGHIAIYNSEKNIAKCSYCPESNQFSQVQAPYAAKLFFQELNSMAIVPRIGTEKF